MKNLKVTLATFCSFLMLALSGPVNAGSFWSSDKGCTKHDNSYKYRSCLRAERIGYQAIRGRSAEQGNPRQPAYRTGNRIGAYDPDFNNPVILAGSKRAYLALCSGTTASINAVCGDDEAKALLDEDFLEQQAEAEKDAAKELAKHRDNQADAIEDAFDAQKVKVQVAAIPASEFYGDENLLGTVYTINPSKNLAFNAEGKLVSNDVDDTNAVDRFAATAQSLSGQADGQAFMVCPAGACDTFGVNVKSEADLVAAYNGFFLIREGVEAKPMVQSRFAHSANDNTYGVDAGKKS